MSRQEVKFKKFTRWNVNGEVKTFEEGDVDTFGESVAAEMVTHNYAEYTDPTKAVKVEENKAIESVDEDKSAETETEAEVEPEAEEEVDDSQAAETARAEIEAAEAEQEGEVKTEKAKPAKKKKGKKKGKKFSKK